MRWALALVLTFLAGLARAEDVDAKIKALAEPDVRVGIWFGPAGGPATYELEPARSLPAASTVKTAILVELFAERHAALDEPIGAPVDAILADDKHPALAPFSAKERAELRAAFAGATPRTVARIMMASQKASNAVYNGAANLAIALLGGPAAATEKIHARWTPGIQVARYMLASRTKNGDNEATPAALAAVLRAIASGKVPGLDDATAAAAKDAMANAKNDPALGAHLFKEGTLDSDPMTAVKTGFFFGGKNGPVVYVVALALSAPPAGSRSAAHDRLERMADGMLRVLVASAVR